MRWTGARALVAALVLVLFAPVVFLLYCFFTLPDLSAPKAPPNMGAFVIQAADGTPVATRGVYKGEPITADHIPQPLGDAVIAIEDRRFFSHDGIDLRGIARAFWNDVRGGHLQGGSTITQQLARLRYLSPEQSIRRKVQEAMLALWLEWHFNKQDILAQYLNSAYFGYGAYGADAAARRYFSKSADELSLNQAAMLAGLIRAPSALEPDKNLDGARDRANIVLAAMSATGAASEKDIAFARQHPAELRVAADAPAGSNYFIDTAVREAKNALGATNSDVAVRSTLDPRLQKLAEDVVRKDVSAAAQSKNVHQAALVAMTRDGAILAMAGGLDYRTSQFNRATQAKRQPGSLFKLFVYLTALRKGFTPDDVMVDRPVQIGNWEPENYGDRYYGPVTLRKAFANSLNSVAVQLAEQVGIDQVVKTARALGVRSDLPLVPSVALGSGNVTLLEMTSAFAAVAANRSAVEPYAVRAVTHGDQILFTRPAPQQQGPADDSIVHSEMLDLLSGPILEGTAKAARLNVALGGKTGTSQEYRDAWFVGFTPDLVVGVWVGNDDNSPMNAVTGGSVPTTIWRDFVSGAQKLRPVRPETVSMAPATEPPTRAPGLAPEINGAPVVTGKLKMLRDGSFELGGQIIQLDGVDALDRRLARHVRKLIRHREANCSLAGADGVYRCRVGTLDLNAFILLSRNGAAAADAEPGLQPPDDDIQPVAPRRHSGRHRFWFFHW